MSRTLTGGMISHLASGTTTRVGMLRLDLQDGSTIAITDHDRELTFDLGDGAAVYSPRTGILPSDLSLSTGFDSDDLEVTGPLVPTATEDYHVTKAMVLGGRLDDATARFFQVNWADLTQGSIALLKGRVVLAEVEGSRFKLTIQSEISRFKQEVGRTITAYCDADFGDARCGYTPATLTATVSSVTSASQFAVTYTGTYANDYFNGGTVQFTSGGLNGTRPVEVTDFTGGTDSWAVLLWTELADVPEIGDTLTFTQGCYDVATGESKTRNACKAFSNIVNFRGFPDVPGSDQVLRYPNPGG